MPPSCQCLAQQIIRSLVLCDAAVRQPFLLPPHCAIYIPSIRRIARRVARTRGVGVVSPLPRRSRSGRATARRRSPQSCAAMTRAGSEAAGSARQATSRRSSPSASTSASKAARSASARRAGAATVVVVSCAAASSAARISSASRACGSYAPRRCLSRA